MHEPEAAGFNGYALLPLVSAILYALAMILTRTKCREENPLVLSLSLNVSFVATGLLATLLMAMVGGPTDEAQGTSFLFGEWSIMGMTKWLTMALLAGNHRQRWRSDRLSGWSEAATWSTPVVRLARGDRGNPREAALAATAPRPDGAGAVCQLQRRIAANNLINPRLSFPQLPA